MLGHTPDQTAVCHLTKTRPAMSALSQKESLSAQISAVV
jgi:hypothetical protein